MINSSVILGILMLLLPLSSVAQEDDEVPRATEVDSLQGDLRAQGIVMEDSIVQKRAPLNPWAPARAAFYSAVFPGLGQIYNKRYWKVPIVYGALGTGIYLYTWNDNQYDNFREAFKRRRAGFTDDAFFDRDGNNPEGAGPDFSLDVLEDQQERFQRDRDLWLVITIGFYILNIVDANVDAHLKQFNISDDLSLDTRPFFEFNEVNGNPNYGMALVITF